MKALIATVTQLAGSLRRRVLRIGCWWHGHDLSNAYTEWTCVRCDQTLSYDDAVKDCQRDKLRDKWRGLKRWWKCDDCGWRFGRHDKNHDHIPF